MVRDVFQRSTQSTSIVEGVHEIHQMQDAVEIAVADTHWRLCQLMRLELHFYHDRCAVSPASRGPFHPARASSARIERAAYAVSALAHDTMVNDTVERPHAARNYKGDRRLRTSRRRRRTAEPFHGRRPQPIPANRPRGIHHLAPRPPASARARKAGRHLRLEHAPLDGEAIAHDSGFALASRAPYEFGDPARPTLPRRAQARLRDRLHFAEVTEAKLQCEAKNEDMVKQETEPLVGAAIAENSRLWGTMAALAHRRIPLPNIKYRPLDRLETMGV